MLGARRPLIDRYDFTMAWSISYEAFVHTIHIVKSLRALWNWNVRNDL